MAASKHLQDRIAARLRQAWEAERGIDNLLQLTPWRRDDSRYWSEGATVKEALRLAAEGASTARRWMSAAMVGAVRSGDSSKLLPHTLGSAPE